MGDLIKDQARVNHSLKCQLLKLLPVRYLLPRKFVPIPAQLC